MKKLLIFAAAITIALSGMAQDKNKGKGHNKDKSEKHSSHKSNDKDDDDDRKYGKNNGNDDVNRSSQNKNSRYSKNVPTPVRNAFNSEFPNARNVSWTKNNGYWTAAFSNGIYRASATYSANGQRVNSATTKTSRPTTTSASEDGSIWDKILTKQ